MWFHEAPRTCPIVQQLCHQFPMAAVMLKTWCESKHRQIPVNSCLWLQSNVDEKNQKRKVQHKFGSTGFCKWIWFSWPLEFPNFMLRHRLLPISYSLRWFPEKRQKQSLVKQYEAFSYTQRHWNAIMNLAKEIFTQVRELFACVGDAQGFCRKSVSANVLRDARSRHLRK